MYLNLGTSPEYTDHILCLDLFVGSVIVEQPICSANIVENDFHQRRMKNVKITA
jgi:hypothetical protein